MKHLLFTFLFSLFAFAVSAADTFVSFKQGSWQLNANGKVSIYVSNGDQKGVRIAADNLVKDIINVCNAETRIVDNPADAQIVIGTAGTVKAVAQYAKQLKGKTEMYLLDVKDKQLYIAGSDRRGTIYGIYELSKQLGVSPWYYWADAPIPFHRTIFLNKGTYTDGEPAVRYRGIFLNDEAPCLTTWVKNTFGTEYGGHEFYAKVFELILRLKGNFLWPAMWGWAFYEDDPLNSKTADEMGVIMGTSHHEPMARNHQEYARRRSEWGAWDYASNKKNIDRFFREGIERSKDNEDLITIGMRGDGDTALGGKEGHDDEFTENEKATIKLLEDICKNQRQIIKEVTGKPAEKRQQVWALYKEVQRYYDLGMKVPDDAIVLLADDNWGDVRRLPSEKELKGHKGGFGMYYHVDYVGGPRNSKWLNVTQTQQMHEQLSLTYDYGVDKLWVLNVGDLKPMEYPIQLFLDMAWKPKEFTTPAVKQHTERFFQENLGRGVSKEVAKKVADIYNTNCKYAARVTAEMLDRNTYNLESGEWRQVRDDYARLEREAMRVAQYLPNPSMDFYQQLVLFPVQAMANLYDMYYAQAMNYKLAPLGDPDAAMWAQEVKDCYVRDSLLCLDYNKGIAHGKWDGMMIQKHIGYTEWHDNFVQKTPDTKAVADSKAYLTNSSDKGYIAIDAERFASQKAPEGTQWTVYPDYGRTRSAIALTPYTQKNTTGAELTYEFTVPEGTDSLAIHVITKSTLDFLSVGGFEYAVSVDGGEPQIVNMNKTLIDQPPYTYTVMYPTVARRVIDKTAKLPGVAAGRHTLTIAPRHPGIVFEQIVIDWGGYKPSYLFK